MFLDQNKIEGADSSHSKEIIEKLQQKAELENTPEAGSEISLEKVLEKHPTVPREGAGSADEQEVQALRETLTPDTDSQQTEAVIPQTEQQKLHATNLELLINHAPRDLTAPGKSGIGWELQEKAIEVKDESDPQAI